MIESVQERQDLERLAVLVTPDDPVPDIIVCRGPGRCHRKPACPFCALFPARAGIDDIDEFVRITVQGH